MGGGGQNKTRERPNVVPRLQQMSCKAVTQSVGRRILLQPDVANRSLKQVSKRALIQMVPTMHLGHGVP
jgi:hypothetical protein